MIDKIISDLNCTGSNWINLKDFYKTFNNSKLTKKEINKIIKFCNKYFFEKNDNKHGLKLKLTFNILYNENFKKN